MEIHNEKKTWHVKHKEKMSYSDRVSDSVSSFVGSWPFLIIQSSIIILWVIWNVVPGLPHFDPYPFILLTLVLSLQAAYAAPIIMMSQNRQTDRDRIQAMEDFETNVQAKQEIEKLMVSLDRIEVEKLDKIITLINNKKPQ
jgi:uncharacterized membrane protein